MVRNLRTRDDAVRFGFRRRSKAGNGGRAFWSCRSAALRFSLSSILFFLPCRAMKLYVGSCIIGLHKFLVGLDLCPTQIFCYIGSFLIICHVKIEVSGFTNRTV
jgi:hypothetical protein